MFTIAIVVFGLTAVNYHIDIIAQLAKINQAVATLINEGLQKILTTPIEWQPSYSFVRLDIKFGADASIVAPGSRAATPVASGTIKTQKVHPDISPALSSPAPGDLDDSEEPTVPADEDTLADTPVPAGFTEIQLPKGKTETPLQKALETNKA